jgi:TIR domain
MSNGSISDNADTGQKVFVSYAREDKRHIEKLARFLESNGHTVWWDHLLIAGEDYREKILQQIDGADKVVVVWSNHSVKSPFVIDEAQRANNLNKLVPVIMDVSEPPMGFGHIHAVTAKNLESEYPAILASVENRQPPTRDQDRRQIKTLRLLLTTVSALLLALLIGYGTYYIYTTVVPRDLTTGLNPALNYQIYYSEKLGIKMVYPKSRLMVDTTQEEQGRIPLHTAERHQEVLVSRSPLPDHNNPRIGRRLEREALMGQGYTINYAGPSNPSNWEDWYILSGEKPNGNEFYYRRWYTEKDVVSIEFDYSKAMVGFYDDAIGAMTLKDRFQFTKR